MVFRSAHIQRVLNLHSRCHSESNPFTDTVVLIDKAVGLVSSFDMDCQANQAHATLRRWLPVRSTSLRNMHIVTIHRKRRKAKIGHFSKVVTIVYASHHPEIF